METERLLIGGLVAILTVAVAPAAAQTSWVEADTAGAPIALINTPVLNAGSCYEIQTDALSPGGDTVMSVRTGTGVTATTVAGADDCATPGSTYDLARSCVRICPTTTRSYTLWIRAWTRYNQGSAWVLVQRVASSSATPGTSICGGPGDPIQLGCWTALSYSLSFGGVSRNVLMHHGPVQYETAELPGSTTPFPGVHAIVLSGYNDDLGTNWDMRPAPSGTYNGNVFSHRSLVSGAQLTAAMDHATLVPGDWNYYTVTGGALSANSAGPLRLIRNDYVHNGSSALAGSDFDGDRLGPGLENLLKSCDNVFSPTHGGVACSSRPGCVASPTGALCRQSHRDSDGDGLRDDLELYGVPLYEGLTYVGGGELPRMGADPSHYDLFVEMDYQGDLLDITGTLCVTTAPTGVPPTPLMRPWEAAEMADQFRITTAAHFPNRDGSAGIWAHFDIGSRPDDPPVPSTTDTDAGDWGGSSCYPYRPFCSGHSACLGAGGTCCLGSACSVAGGEVVPVGRCITFDRRAHEMSPQRRAFFDSLYRIPIGGAAIGSCPVFAYANDTSQLVHEMGHMGCLVHSGPNNVGLGDEFNNRVNHLSRINYTYQYLGWTGPGFSHPDASRVSFSNGELPDLRPLSVTEVCPLASSPNYDIIDQWSVSHRGAVSFATTCPGIDWNLDGVNESSASATVEARLGVDRFRTLRDVARPAEYVAESGPELVVAGDRIVRFRIAAAGPLSTQSLRYATGSSYACSEAPQAGATRFPPCAFLDTTETVVDTGGTSFRPVAVAADSVELTTSDPTIVVWRTAASQLRAGVLGSGSSWTLMPVLSGTPTLASMASGNGIPAVARIHGTTSVLLVYRNSAGALVEQVGTISGSSLLWTGPTTIAAIPNDGTVVGSPALTAGDGSLVTNGNLMMIGRRTASTFELRIWRRTSAGVWSLVETVDETFPVAPATFKTIWGRGDISIRPFRIGMSLSRRVLVSWRLASTGQVAVTMGPANAIMGVWRSDAWDGGAIHGYMPDFEYDGRTNVAGVRGLRGLWGPIGDCGTGCPGGTTCRSLTGGVVSGTPSTCITTDGLLLAPERRAPAADGVVPMISEDFDEWRMLRHAFCARLRDENMLYAATPYREDRSSCEPAPDYGL